MTAPSPETSASPVAGPATLKSRRGEPWLNRRSLRFQLTAGILLVLVPSFAVSYIGINHIAVREITRLTKDRLKSEAELISYGLHEWGNNNRTTLKTLSYARVLRERNKAGSQELLNALEGLYPHREWRYWSADPQPRLLAATGTITQEGVKRAESSILNRPYFQEALKGLPSYSVVQSYLTNRTCLMVAQPVYRTIDHGPSSAAPPASFPFGNKTAGAPGHQQQPGDAAKPPRPQGNTSKAEDEISHLLSTNRFKEKPTGVLLSCVLLRYLGRDTGLEKALQDSNLASLGGSYVNFNKARSLRSSFLLVSRQGHLLYPTVSKEGIAIPTIADHLNGYWGPLFRVAQKATHGQETFDKVKVGDQSYFVLINTADSAWSTMLVLSEKEALRSLHDVLRILILFGLGSIALTSIAIYLQCGRIIAPIRKAGEALQQISEGNFDIKVEHNRQDEIGALLENINHTSAQLKLYLSQETAHAITQKQIDTAREIQKDFLVAAMPQSPLLEIAPVFLPAYEVGADWYDAVHIGNTTYFVVADVCDKGIPSALYMSVFRSLLRYGLLTHVREEDEEHNEGCRLREVVTLVNDYMATNHGDSMMFATVFMGAINAEKGELHYVSGGHEMPLLCRPDSHQLLEQTGPAVGLFAGATYTSGQVALQPGDYLVTYTDGLIDARSPDNVGWGRDSLVQFMAERAGGNASAATVLQDLVATAEAYMAGADQFDDLTVMVMRMVPQAPVSD